MRSIRFLPETEQDFSFFDPVSADLRFLFTYHATLVDVQPLNLIRKH
jgi:hypothetical protein